MLAVGWALQLGGCKINPYRLEFPEDGGLPDVNTGPDVIVPDARPDAPPRSDAGPDACIPSPEVCNNRDDNCNGQVDEGFDLNNDPRNCGSCGNACTGQPNASGSCSNKTCSFACIPGYVDLDNDLGTTGGTGCEYACIPTNGGVEICDGVDNDCNGIIDDGVDLMHDVNNCGACGHVCVAVHATPMCDMGTCTYSTDCAGNPNCVNGCDCDTGTATGDLAGKCYSDITPSVIGCEYQCPQFPPSATEDKCDNVDNNCNGQVDEGNPQGGQDCTPDSSWVVGGTSTCKDGITTCVGGNLVCGGFTGPTAEICDGKDNNCDGSVDENFNLQSDPNHCGGVDPATGLCTVCSFPHAVPKCASGSCEIAYCLTGFVDLDKDPSNGCEYPCTPTGPEVCDGVDNDCDGIVDNADKLTAPQGLCATRGECAGTTPTCSAGPPGCADTTVTWRCDYPSTVQTDTCGNLIGQETLCDGKDNDCDGVADDPFTNLNKQCDDGKLGVCRGTGTYQCTADHTTTSCVITNPGQVAAANDTTCDGIDDDCDGQLDEDVVDDMQHIVAGGKDFYIDTYEASHPDATGSAQGTMTHRSCSKSGVLPWSNLTETEAEAACEAGGMRLCSDTEWQLACQGPSGFTYPYGNNYDANACNGADYDNCSTSSSNVEYAAGKLYECPGSKECLSGYNVADLSGNVKEWTSTVITSSSGSTSNEVRGGAYDNVALGLTCTFNFLSLPPSDHFPNVGFRCCKTGP